MYCTFVHVVHSVCTIYTCTCAQVMKFVICFVLGFTLSAGSLLDWVKEKVTEITTEKSKICKCIQYSMCMQPCYIHYQNF